jgi:hypothetical protein
MEKKRCLFCNQIVPIQTKDDHDRYIGCYCSPEGYYGIRTDSYDYYDSLSYQTKHRLFSGISAYIRDMTDEEEVVVLGTEHLEAIENSPRKPATIEQKGLRLLRYLHRHTHAPGETVVIRLSENFNLTYSPNLQELVYIIEKLKEENLLERIGSLLSLTEKGWREAAASAGGEHLKPCFVYLSDDEGQRTEWSESVLPKIEQCGYYPRLADNSGTDSEENQTIKLISASKVLIADVTGQSPDVYFAAGYAHAMNIPVIWTIKHSGADQLSASTDHNRPFVWETADDLASMLQQRLGAYDN